MDNYKFRCWCEKAVSGIAYPPDKRTVYRELMDHMEDRYDDLRQQGQGEDAARQLAMEAMGDPWSIAKDLAAIHRPFWGYCLRVTRILLVIALAVTLIPFCIHAWNTEYGAPVGSAEQLFYQDYHGSIDSRTLLHLKKHDVSQKTDGYTFTLTDSVYWHNSNLDTNVLYVYIEEFHPLPWAGHGAIENWFWAEDSLGNIYEGIYTHPPEADPLEINCFGNSTSPFHYTYVLSLSTDLIQDAQWIDIHYTRDGRNLRFRVDLTGGDRS